MRPETSFPFRETLKNKEFIGMTVEQGRIPPGPAEKYDTSEDLLRWLNDQFDRFGSIYRASIYGTDVYVVNDPEYVDRVLRINWRNYKRGQAIKRIGFLLGNGLIVSEGEFWKSQRQMIQPAFHDKAISALAKRHFGGQQGIAREMDGCGSRAKKREYHARHQSYGPEGCAHFPLRRRLRTGCTAFQYPRR
jgi:hypothetical protein